MGTEVGHPYLPLAPGIAWRYATSQSHPAAELAGVESTLRVVSLRREPGRLIAELVDRADGENALETRYQLVATVDGILPGVGTMRVGETEVRSRDAVGLYLPFSVGLDHSWSYAVTYESEAQVTVVRGTVSAIAEEPLATGAGSFRVLRLRGEVRTEMDPGRGLARIVQVQHEESFYAKGVGLVRSVTRTDAGYQAIKELTRWERCVGGGGDYWCF